MVDLVEAVNTVARIVKLERERREPFVEGDEWDAHMARFREAREAQQQLLSEVTLEEFEHARGELFRIRSDASDEVIASMAEKCGSCGHRRGAHRSGSRAGCGIGGERHNKHYGRQDDPCFCLGFTTQAQKEEADREDAEEEARREAAPFQCQECDEVFEDESDFVRLYECNECGSIFSYENSGSNRCEQCGKFASKLTDDGCPECEQGEVAPKEAK